MENLIGGFCGKFEGNLFDSISEKLLLGVLLIIVGGVGEILGLEKVREFVKFGGNRWINLDINAGYFVQLSCWLGLGLGNYRIWVRKAEKCRS